MYLKFNPKLSDAEMEEAKRMTQISIEDTWKEEYANSTAWLSPWYKPPVYRGYCDEY
jgi:hypothetical protein